MIYILRRIFFLFKETFQFAQEDIHLPAAISVLGKDLCYKNDFSVLIVLFVLCAKGLIAVYCHQWPHSLCSIYKRLQGNVIFNMIYITLCFKNFIVRSIIKQLNLLLSPISLSQTHNN